MHEKTTLGSACSLIVDCEHKTAPLATIGTEYAYSIGTPNIRNGRIAYSTAKLVDQSTYEAWTARAIPEQGDIILTREAPVGEAAFVDGKERVCLGQRTVLLRPNSSITHSRYLHYKLLSPDIQKSMISQAEGSTVPHLNLGDIRKLDIGELPSLRQQDTIASLLGALDDKITVNDRIAATWEQVLRLRFAALKIDTETSSVNAIAASDLADFNPRRRAADIEDAVYLEMASLPTDSARIRSWSRRPPKSGTRFMNGDTVMARITPCLENGKTAYVDFLKDGEVGIGSTEFIVMRARDNIPSHLPYFLARSPRFREHAIRNMVGSSGRQRVAAASLTDIPLQRPDEEALREFAGYASSAFKQMKSLDAETRTLAELRDSLLPKLMSGQIRIKEAESVVGDAV